MTKPRTAEDWALDLTADLYSEVSSDEMQRVIARALHEYAAQVLEEADSAVTPFEYNQIVIREREAAKGEK